MTVTMELTWDEHANCFREFCDFLYKNNSLTDCTLFCKNGSLKSHKIMLAACSPYFNKVIAEAPCKHPVFVFPSVNVEEMNALMHYIYKGKMSFSKDSFDKITTLAADLKIKGLEGEMEAEDSLEIVSETVEVKNEVSLILDESETRERSYFEPQLFENVIIKPFVEVQESSNSNSAAIIENNLENENIVTNIDPAIEEIVECSDEINEECVEVATNEKIDETLKTSQKAKDIAGNFPVINIANIANIEVSDGTEKDCKSMSAKRKKTKWDDADEFLEVAKEIRYEKINNKLKKTYKKRKDRYEKDEYSKTKKKKEENSTSQENFENCLCDICGEIFSNKLLLNEHTILTHRDKNITLMVNESDKSNSPELETDDSDSEMEQDSNFSVPKKDTDDCDTNVSEMDENLTLPKPTLSRFGHRRCKSIAINKLRINFKKNKKINSNRKVGRPRKRNDENNTQSLKNDVDVEKNKGNEENSEKVESGVKKESKKVPTFTENGWVLMPLKKKKKPLSSNFMSTWGKGFSKPKKKKYIPEEQTYQQSSRKSNQRKKLKRKKKIKNSEEKKEPICDCYKKLRIRRRRHESATNVEINNKNTDNNIREEIYTTQEENNSSYENLIIEEIEYGSMEINQIIGIVQHSYEKEDQNIVENELKEAENEEACTENGKSTNKRINRKIIETFEINGETGLLDRNSNQNNLIVEDLSCHIKWDHSYCKSSDN